MGVGIESGTIENSTAKILSNSTTAVVIMDKYKKRVLYM